MATPLLQTYFDQMPLPYELNAGQSDPAVLALTHGPGFGFWLTDSSMVFSVPHSDAQSGQVTGSDVFTLNLAGSSGQGNLEPGVLLDSRANYFAGSDSSKWVTDANQYTSLTYPQVYPGIDLNLGSSGVNERTFEYGFTLQPGANLSQIQLSAEGLHSLQLDDQGRLLLGTSGGNVIMDAPVFYQTIGGVQQDVAGSYVLGDNDTFGFAVTGSYDPTQPLVLDPAVSYSSYLGGSGNDYGAAITVDQSESSYITGTTLSSDFPAVNGFSSTLSGNQDIFVTKLSSDGSDIVYSTYLGGTTTGGLMPSPASQAGRAISVNAAGDAVIGGSTTADDFPTTSGAYDTSGATMGVTQAVVVKLNATGDALEWSTYLGSTDSVSGIAMDTTGVYVTGNIFMSGMLPTTTGAFQTSYGGGGSDAFVTKLTSSGNAMSDHT